MATKLTIENSFDYGDPDKVRPSELGASAGSMSSTLADRIITALECKYRDWLSPEEYAESREMIQGVIDARYLLLPKCEDMPPEAYEALKLDDDSSNNKVSNER